eukprot:superscaffoldBa00002068_g13065
MDPDQDKFMVPLALKQVISYATATVGSPPLPGEDTPWLGGGDGTPVDVSGPMYPDCGSGVCSSRGPTLDPAFPKMHL